ncbi:hypothetical protein SY85_21495 [Flavisolibacter tropicus]|uniref:Uncharacterized protein n=1 Tax=Flavisolibacter tropicus TaxID=1492898 RepID=A0A172U0B8_9BACT|nr:hypothetical protein SY85_21495 [Flavisolibacter tropicus]
MSKYLAFMLKKSSNPIAQHGLIVLFMIFFPYTISIYPVYKPPLYRGGLYTAYMWLIYSLYTGHFGKKGGRNNDSFILYAEHLAVKEMFYLFCLFVFSRII